MNKEKPKIVILGGGFGGVYAYRSLMKEFGGSECHITLISKNDNFLFVPLIHEVATGNLLPSSITQPLRTIAPNCGFIEGEVTSINADEKKVHVRNIEVYKEKAQPKKEISNEISYDYLVVALGARTNFWNVGGAEDFSYPLYHMGDAKAIKNEIIERFEHAQFLKSEKQIKDILTFAIIGGGATGVEIAGEIADLVNHEIRDSFGSLAEKSSIKIIHGGDRLLPHSPDWMSKSVASTLSGMGVSLRFNEIVTKIEKDKIIMGEKEIPVGMSIWAAGVKAQEIKIKGSGEVERDKKTRRIKVNEFLQIPSYPNIFVVGDQAYVHNKEEEQSYPMRAQFAVREGVTAGENIKRLTQGQKLKEFKWKEVGFIVSLGAGKAVSILFGKKLSGFLAWIIYRTAFLLKIIGIKAKIRTALEWTLNLFLPRDISKI